MTEKDKALTEKDKALTEKETIIIELAKTLKKNNVAVDIIIQKTNLTREVIEKL